MRRHLSVLMTAFVALTIGFTGTAPPTGAAADDTAKVSVSITTNPPMDLQVVAMTGREQLSGPYELTLSLIGTDVTATSLLGASLDLEIRARKGPVRVFTGIVAEVSEGEPVKRNRSFTATVVPEFALLEHTQDSRIFRDISTPDIVAFVASGVGMDLRLSEPHPPASCVTQYRETDFDFVSRLMEEEGMFYFWSLHDTGPVLVIGDSPAAFDDGGNVTTNPEHDASAHRLTPGRVTLNDFNPLTPGIDLIRSADSRRSLLDKARYEIYDYPGGYQDAAAGARLAEATIASLDATAHTISARTTDLTVAPGTLITIGGRFAGRYLVTSTLHSLSKNGYSSSFEAIPSDTAFRPLRTTPKPTVAGSQTAIVTGPPGEDVYSDEHGRVKVQFHWDRTGQRDENSSCWIRVSQTHASDDFGIPRIGEEVVVDFLDGDPDRPIITGRMPSEPAD